MKLYHVVVEQEDDWYLGRVLERGGITTQGRTLDELVVMLRDAIETLWNENAVQLELLVTPEIVVSKRRRTQPRKASA